MAKVKIKSKLTNFEFILVKFYQSLPWVKFQNFQFQRLRYVPRQSLKSVFLSILLIILRFHYLIQKFIHGFKYKFIHRSTP